MSSLAVVDVGVGVESATKLEGARDGPPLTTISCSPGVSIVLIVPSELMFGDGG
jgi:hypothetical protein